MKTTILLFASVAVSAPVERVELAQSQAYYKAYYNGLLGVPDVYHDSHSPEMLGEQTPAVEKKSNPLGFNDETLATLQGRLLQGIKTPV
jgi:hypothetical protein